MRATYGEKPVFVDPKDLSALRGQGSQFQKLVYDLVVEEARSHGISPVDIDSDYRVNFPDAGFDIFVRASHDDPNPRLIPNTPSIWSVKSGKDGVKAGTLSSEIKLASHDELRNELREGTAYRWCALYPIAQAQMQKMRRKVASLADDCQFQQNQVKFVGIEAIAKILEDHPNVVVRHLPDLKLRFDGILTLTAWERQNPDRKTHVDWVGFGGRNQLKQRIRDHLLGSTEPAVLHLAGLSGIGKTRTVIQACLDDDNLKDTYYAPRFDELSREFLSYIESSERYVKAVIDEVSLAEWQRLANRFNDLANRVRLITVGPARRGERDRMSDPSLLILEEPDTVDGVLRVIEEAGRGLPETVLRSIAEVSSHDLRLALLLVIATKREPSWRDVPLYDLGEVWQRVTSVFQDGLGDLHAFGRSYEFLTSAVDVGRAGKHRDEVQYLASHFGVTSTELDRAINSADACGLGTQTPAFFEAGPRSLAVWVFQDRLWPVLKSTVDQFLSRMPTARLKRRFIERCHEVSADRREEVAERVGHFF